MHRYYYTRRYNEVDRPVKMNKVGFTRSEINYTMKES